MLIIVAGHDDETWDLGVTLPRTTLEAVRLRWTPRWRGADGVRVPDLLRRVGAMFTWPTRERRQRGEGAELV